ncbi:MAG: hypothetical protein AAB352_01530 [Patescibacteria group bacterium]
MNKSLAFLLVIGGVIIFILGGGAGVFYQTQQTQQNIPPNNEAVAATTAVKSLSSKVIPSIVAFGEVASISGRNITLKNAGESLIIKIDENAQISSFNAVPVKGTNTPTQGKAEFKDIKVGNTLSINLRLLPSAVLKGMSVVIINSLPNTNVAPK